MEDTNRACSRCPHCAGPLSKDMETSSWTVAPLIRDSFSMIGSSVGGTASAFYGFNHGGTLPALAQLVSSSYHAAMSSSPRHIPPPRMITPLPNTTTSNSNTIPEWYARLQHKQRLQKQ